jgi:hypothetical protein
MTRIGERARLGRWFESLAVASRPLQRRPRRNDLAFDRNDRRGGKGIIRKLHTPHIHQEIPSGIIRAIRGIRGSPNSSCLLVSIRGLIILSGICGTKFSKIFPTSEESNHELRKFSPAAAGKLSRWTRIPQSRD